MVRISRHWYKMGVLNLMMILGKRHFSLRTADPTSMSPRF